MDFMFWKKKPKGSDKAPEKAPAAPGSAGKPSREEIIAKAKASAAAAREEIGDETLEKIKEAIQRRQNSPAEKAKQIIKNMEDGRVRTHLSELLKEDKDKTRH